MLQTEQHKDTKREICFVFSNICKNGNETEVISLCLNSKLINSFGNVFSSSDKQAVLIALEVIKNILAIG